MALDTSTPGALWAGYAWRRRTSGHNRALRAPKRHMESRTRELAEENENALL